MQPVDNYIKQHRKVRSSAAQSHQEKLRAAADPGDPLDRFIMQRTTDNDYEIKIELPKQDLEDLITKELKKLF